MTLEVGGLSLLLGSDEVMETVRVDGGVKCSIVEWHLISASNAVARYVFVDCA